MLKTIALILVTSILFTGSTFGQALSASPVPPARSDLKTAIADETKRIEDESASVDSKEMERESRRGSRAKMTGKQKTWIVLGVVGFAALIFLLIKYGRECLRYESGCDASSSTPCQCLEYAPRN